MKRIKHIRDLQENMIDLFHLIEQEEIPIAVAKELNNTAGKILKCSSQELEHNRFLAKKRMVPFIENAASAESEDED